MAQLSLDRICSFFDELDEDWLTPFDWNPNEKLPDHGRTYRIKDFFKAYHYGKVCKYREDEEDICKIKFMCIYRENVLVVFQKHDEITKLKMIADHHHYEQTSSGNKKINTAVNTTDRTTNTASNKMDRKNSSGTMAGSVDTLQLGTFVDKSRKIVETKHLLEQSPNKIMDVMDPNMRAYTQNVGKSDDIEVYTVDDTLNSNTNVTTIGDHNLTTSKGIEALNQIRAHDATVVSLTNQFLEKFSVLFY